MTDREHIRVLDIVNNCFRRLGLNPVNDVGQTRLSNLAVGLINDVLDDISLSGDWPEATRAFDVTAATSTNRFKVQVTIAATADVIKNIGFLYFAEQEQPLMPQTIGQIRRWCRSSSVGTPRHFAVVGTSANNPIIYVYPEPVTASGQPFNFQAHVYVKHRTLTTADGSIVPMYNSRIVEQGLYARLLMEENGGDPNAQSIAALSDYMRMKQEHLNRFTYDSGDDEIQFSIG